MIEVELHNFPGNNLFFALNKKSKEITEFLLEKDIPIMQVVKYIVDKTPNVNGKTTLFSDGTILVRMDYFNNSIRYISILNHELLHASKRLVEDKGEEAEAYMLGYIFEEIMKKLKPVIDYTEQPVDFEWLEKMTK